MASKGRSWVKGILFTLLGIVVVLVAAVVGVLLWFDIPSNASGMAAVSVCSAKFMGGRPGDAQQLMTQDVLPASGVLKAISTEIDTNEKTVSATFLGAFKRSAAFAGDRGCVLDLQPDPGARPYDPASQTPDPWPAGNTPLPPAQWPTGVNAAGLQAVVAKAFEGAGDPAAANARGVAVVQDNRLLVSQTAPGFEPGTGLHGWSMTKTVAAMLAYKKFTEVGLNIQQPVVDSFPAKREPSWVADWRKDERAKITVADLMFMRDGLKITEGYDPTGDVIQMLYGEPDMSGWAASHPAEVPAGTRWQYLSATSNILAAVTRAQFPSDAEYFAYPKTALFGPLSATSASLATDTSGTEVASSYQWASVGDWARFGQLMLSDGKWGDKQVIPPGWVKLATTPAMPSGDGHGYGAQTWLPGDPVGGECRSYPGVPADTMSMEGHWGQIVAMVPSRNAVVVRLGWTFDKPQFDKCQFVADVLANLPPK